MTSRLRALRARLTYANVAATVALFLALGGVAVASTAVVRSKHIVNDTIRTVDLKDGQAVEGVDVADGSLSGADIAGDSLGGAQVDESTLSGLPRTVATGTIAAPFALGNGTCVTNTPEVAGVAESDHVLVTVPAAWDDTRLTLVAAAAAGELKVSLCNVGSALATLGGNMKFIVLR